MRRRDSNAAVEGESDSSTPVLPFRPRRPRRAGAREATSLTAVEVRARWRRATLDSGWSFPADWWVPAIDAITEAFVAGQSVLPGFHRLGMARSDAGVPMQETLCDATEFASLAREILASDAHSARLGMVDATTIVQVAATGWAERISIAGAGAEASDPLTQLARPNYLPVRLGEIYRAAESKGESVCHTHAIVVVSLLHASDRAERFDPAGSSPFETIDRSRHMVTLSGVLHSVFSSGETLATLGPSTAAVIAARDRGLSARVTALRELLERERLSHSAPYLPPVGVWLEGLPTSLRHAVQLLGELKR
ncbi:hypothetical protein CLV47_12087 [Antricoccus suffuscus]|uniref:Uncharacterized protein n=1 Tax=Antricoccus suffuscus TaxID=1629062 RepID=A0A2T0ZQK7_9ACTN|nr:hypothetical protein [Antricoccus suffuscus]PRZ38620.1 hypothetical protein CLV47_12087 [Antricoccus suffuscus]